MASMFCKHGRLDCKPCNHHMAGYFPGILGETVPKLGVQSLVPKGRRGKERDVRWMVNPRTGHREKMYFNWGVGKYFSGVKDTEKYLKSRGLEAGANDPG